jgi:hypothetical protein
MVLPARCLVIGNPTLTFLEVSSILLQVELSLKSAMVIDSGRDSVAYHVPTTAQDKPKTKQLPVTLLSGFLVRQFEVAERIIKAKLTLCVGKWKDHSVETHSQVTRSWLTHRCHCE